MYSITSKSPNKTLVSYLSKPLISTIRFNGFKYTYTSADGKPRACGGITTTLKNVYYPDFERKKKQYRRKGKGVTKKASTKSQGILIDKQIQAYIKNGRKPKNKLALALVVYLEEKCKHTLQAAQVPLFIKDFGGKITQADIITQDEHGKLYMAEIKSGYNQVQAQGTLNGLPDVPNNVKNQWELQRHFTHKGLVECGLPLTASYILNVYQEGSGVTVKKRKNPSWVKSLPS